MWPGLTEVEGVLAGHTVTVIAAYAEGQQVSLKMVVVPGIAEPSFVHWTWPIAVSDSADTPYLETGGGINPSDGAFSIVDRDFGPAPPFWMHSLEVVLVGADGVERGRGFVPITRLAPHFAGGQVRPASEDDIESWLEIVREVEPLFGPMPEFDATLRRAIASGRALLCAPAFGGPVLGGVLIGGADRPRINWLAVRSSHREQGVGRALVSEALRQYRAPCEITVDTFGPDNPDGLAARRLYESFGFAAAEVLDPGPEGGSRQRFRLRLPLPGLPVPGNGLTP